MSPRDPSSDSLLVCPLPPDVRAAIEHQAREEGLDVATLVRDLLDEALHIRALERAVEEQQSAGAVVIPFVRPPWAVDHRGGGDDA